MCNSVKAVKCWNIVVDTGKVPEYIRTMSEEVSSLEEVKRRVQVAAQSTVGILESLNGTVIDIETRSAAALNTSQQALQVTRYSAVRAALVMRDW